MPSGKKPAPGPFTQEIASILRAERARKQIGQTQLAAAVNLSQSQLSGMLSGSKHLDIEKLDEIAWALGVDLVREVIAPADDTVRLRQTAPSWKAKKLAD